MLQTTGIGPVFARHDVIACVMQQVICGMQASGVIEAFLNRGMVFNIFTVVNRSLPDFVNSGVDLAYCDSLMRCNGRVGRAVLDHPSGRAQIGQRVQIAGMIAGYVGTGGHGSKCGAQQSDRSNEGTVFHFFKVKDVVMERFVGASWPPRGLMRSLFV